MGYAEGLHVIGDYTVGSNEDKVEALLALIQNPDTSHGNVATNTYLDEMNPGAAAQLRVEIAALAAEIEAGVDTGETIPVVNSAGADSHNGTVTVVGEEISKLTLAATVAFVDNADVVAVHNSAGADSHNATAEVALGVLTDVKFAATVAMVDDLDTISGYVLGVAAGVISSIDHAQVWADGTFVVSGGQAAANQFVVATGITLVATPLARIVVSVTRAGASVLTDAVITDGNNGSFTVADGSTYNTTAGDVVTWFAKK